MTKRCLICERSIVADDVGIHDATIWTSQGNYGSAVYDPLHRETFLEAWVCDACLVRKKALIEEVEVRRGPAIVERRPPDF
jgi:hypothetical protein